MGTATFALLLSVAFMGEFVAPLATPVVKAVRAAVDWVNATCPTTEHILVARTARMYTEPDAMAAGFGLTDGEEFDVKSASRGLGIPFRHVSTRGDWIEVDSVGEDSGRCLCQGPHYGLKDFSLRLFVRQEAVLEVVTRDVEGTDAAGLKYWIRAGAQVEQFGGKRRTVGLPQSMAASLPDDALGKRFVPRAFQELARSDESVEYILCGDDKLHRKVDLGTGACSSYWPALGIRVTASKDDKPVRAVAVRESGCVRVEGEYAVAPPDRAAILRQHKMMIIGVSTDSEQADSLSGAFPEGLAAEVYAVEAGASAWWPNGKPAGAVRKRHSFTVPPDIVEKRFCFTEVIECAVNEAFGLGSPDDCSDPTRHEHIRLCFDPQDVEKK